MGISKTLKYNLGFSQNSSKMVAGKNTIEAGSSSYSIPIQREDTPLLGSSHQSSKFKTLANIFIAIVGSGVLGLPYTFMKSGWVFGLLTLFGISVLTFYCMLLLLSTRRKIESLNGYSKVNSFGDLGFAVCGSVGRLSIDFMIILSQAGFCVSYLIFITNTLAHVFNNSSVSNVFLGMSPKKLYVWGCLPFQLGLNSIPTLTHLAPLSIFADVVQIGAMGVVMGKDAVVLAQTKAKVQAFEDWGVFFYLVGVCTYSFEGIGMVFPIEAETRDKKAFPKILGLSMGMISFLYGAFGVMGYLAFGDQTRDIITTNIGKGLVSTLVQLGLCINLFLTFPLMMNPVYEVLERRWSEARYSLWIRWLVVLVVSLVALMVPNFADFLSLVGSSVCIGLGFIFPSLFHLIVFKDELGWLRLMVDLVIIVVGLIFGLWGTWSSLARIFAPEA